ncbi:MAG TPA: GNAT family N-acetyltransferase [Pirellulales bacterium]|nr:GNAT family N-acetyltransferase [Pirellulales bacterium]
MEVECITGWDELAGLAPYWTALARGVPFRSWSWLGAWWRLYGHADDHGGPRRLFALAVYDRDQTLVGLAPWCLDSSARQGNVVRFLGSGNVCSDYLSILSLPDHEAEVADALADWLCQEPCAENPPWNVLMLSGVDAGDRVTCRFIEQMIARGSLAWSQPGPNCWRIDLPPSWDDYLASLSKSHRKQVRRLERRLFATGRAVVRIGSDPADLDRGLATLGELHQRRRGGLGQRGRFADDRFADFHQQVARQLLADRLLRLAQVDLDGRPVAAEYQVLGQDVVYAYQSGIDPAALDFEPGRLAMIATLRMAIEQGYRAFDLLRGDEPYKAHWRAHPRPSLQVSLWSTRAADRFRGGAWRAGLQVRHWLRAGWKRAAALAQVV